MTGILMIENMNRGNTLKQGDLSTLKYRLYDADDDKLAISGKPATVRLMKKGFTFIAYEKEGLVVSSDNTISFNINKVLPGGTYYLEVLVDEQYVFPSRGAEGQFNIDKSSMGAYVNIVEAAGVEAVVRKATGMMKQDEEFINDMIENVISDTNVGNIEEYYNQFNQATTEFESLKTQARNSVTKSDKAIADSASAKSIAQGIDAKATEALSKSTDADALSKSVQSQFNQVIIDGDSSVEAAQARVDASGNTNATLKERLDKEHNEVTAQLAQTVYSLKIEPSETDDSFNTTTIRDALKSAEDIGASIFKFPYKKTFLITPFRGGTGIHDRGEATFLVPSNMTIDLNGSTLKVKPNDLPGYKVFEFTEDTINSTLRNGKLVGDRHEHAFKSIPNNDSHEWGYGVELKGTNNIVEHLEITQMTGDGVYKGGYRNNNWGLKLFNSDFQTGTIDDSGSLDTTFTTNVVSNILNLSQYTEEGTKNLIVEPYWEGENTIQYDTKVKVVFYKDGEYLKPITQLIQTEVIPPANATDFRIEFINANLDFDNFIYVNASKIGRNNKVRHCHIHDCRRQGISTSRNENGIIEHNIIHNIRGVAPQAGIDIEDSRYTLNNLTIRKNTIYDTQNANIIAYDGFNVKIEDNILTSESKTSGVGTIITIYSNNLSVTGNLLYGEIRIGNTQKSANQYNRNIFENNICINNNTPNTSKRVVFWNTDVRNCRFVDYYTYNADDKTEFKNCQFEDNITDTSRPDFTGGKYKDGCIFNIKHRPNGIRMGGVDEIIDCEITANSLEINDIKRLERSKITSDSYYIRTSNTGLTSIKENTFLNQQNFTRITLNTIALIEKNTFSPSMSKKYDYVDLQLESNSKLVWLKHNYQDVTASVVGFRIGGNISDATVLSEGNYSNTSTRDFYVTATGVSLKSKDDYFPNSSGLGNQSSIKRHTTVYS